jgi:hypothetical protein
MCNQSDSDSECSQSNGSSINVRLALQKRLQRARKFLLLADIFWNGGIEQRARSVG